MAVDDKFSSEQLCSAPRGNCRQNFVSATRWLGNHSLVKEDEKYGDERTIKAEPPHSHYWFGLGGGESNVAWIVTWIELPVRQNLWRAPLPAAVSPQGQAAKLLVPASPDWFSDFNFLRLFPTTSDDWQLASPNRHFTQPCQATLPVHFPGHFSLRSHLSARFRARSSDDVVPTPERTQGNT